MILCVRPFFYIYTILAPLCIESEIRLLNGQAQICHNEVWGYVCGDSDWTDDDASVICRELGFVPQGKECSNPQICNELIIMLCRCRGFN